MAATSDPGGYPLVHRLTPATQNQLATPTMRDPELEPLTGSTFFGLGATLATACGTSTGALVGTGAVAGS